LVHSSFVNRAKARRPRVAVIVFTLSTPQSNDETPSYQFHERRVAEYDRTNASSINRLSLGWTRYTFSYTLPPNLLTISAIELRALASIFQQHSVITLQHSSSTFWFFGSAASVGLRGCMPVVMANKTLVEFRNSE
jgi:hypothetical protein